MASGEAVSSSIADWKELASEDIQKELSTVAEAVADRLQQINESRTRLIEQTREFKRNCSEDVRTTVAPILRIFQAEVDAAAKRTKSADSTLLAVYKRLVRMPAMLPMLEHCQQMSTTLQKLESENQLFKVALDNHEANAKSQELIIKELKDQLMEFEGKIDSVVEAKFSEREQELERKFETRFQQLHVVQQSLVEKLAAMEQRTMALHFALSSASSEIASLRSKVDVDNTTANRPPPPVIQSCNSALRPLLVPATGLPFGVQLLCAPLRNVLPNTGGNDCDRAAPSAAAAASVATDVALDFRVDQSQASNKCPKEDGISSSSAAMTCGSLPTLPTIVPLVSSSPLIPSAASSNNSQQLSPLCLARPQLQLSPSSRSSSDLVRSSVSVKFEDRELSELRGADTPGLSDGELVAAGSVVDTVQVAKCTRQLLGCRNILLRDFARDVLGVSQGSIADLLAKPKPWDRLSEKHRDLYRQMYQWLIDQSGGVGLSSSAAATVLTDTSNTVTSTMNSSAMHQSDNSAITELRVAQILSEAKAAMRAAEDNSVKRNDQSTVTDNRSCLEDKATSELSEASTQSCGDENKYVPVAMASASTDEDMNGVPQQSAVPGNSASVIVESNPRDIVARIYREELLKLAEAARVNGNLTEFVMYERELERLNQTTGQNCGGGSVSDVPVSSPALSLGPARHRDRKQANRTRKANQSASAAAVSRAPSVPESSSASVDYPEDLRTNHIKQEMTVQQFIPSECDRDGSRASQSAFVQDSGGVEQQSGEGSTCGRFLSLTATSSGLSSVPLTNLATVANVCDDELDHIKVEIQQRRDSDPKDDHRLVLMRADENESPLDLIQTIANSMTTSKSPKKPSSVASSAPSPSSVEVARHSLPPITSEQLKRCSNLNTEEIVIAVRTTLADYSISQRLFGEAVLGLSQGSVSDLLARPKPWPLLTSKGREPFIRMRLFLDDPEAAVRQLVTTQYKVPAEKLLRCSDAAESEAAHSVRKRKNSIESGGSENGQVTQTSKKQPRVSFTSEQKEALREAYIRDPYPTQPSIDKLAAELGIGPRTVVNWFHNHRMRYAKQQYAATGIWSVTGPVAGMTGGQKMEPCTDDDDTASRNGFEQDGSIADRESLATDQMCMEDNDLDTSVSGLDCPTGNEDSDSANCGSHSMLVAANSVGSNRRKSHRPQRLGIAGVEASA